MSDGLKDSLFWIGSGFGKGQGQGGPWDLTDPDDTQEIEIDAEWWQDIIKELNESEWDRVKKQCVCGGAATANWNCHATYCPAFRPTKP